MCTVIGDADVRFPIGCSPPDVHTSPPIHAGTVSLPEPPKTVGGKLPRPSSQICFAVRPPTAGGWGFGCPPMTNP